MALGAQTSAEQVGSNLASWLRLFGMDRVPAWLNTSHADTIVTVLGLLMAVSMLAWWWVDKIVERKADADRCQSEAVASDPEAEWVPTEAEIREECAAHGWPRAEPYLTQAREHLQVERMFNEMVASERKA